MTLELYLIRHGESETNEIQAKLENDRKIVWGRNTWSQLTQKGIAQSRELGKYLKEKGLKFDKMISSTTVRAQQTARYCIEEMVDIEHLYETLGRLEVTLDLAEHYHGEWEGRYNADIGYHEITRELRKNFLNYLTFNAPGGESPDQVGRRAKSYIEKNILDKGYKSVALFTHRGVFAWLLPELFRINPQESFQMKIPNASITILRYDETWIGFEVGVYAPII